MKKRKIIVLIFIIILTVIDQLSKFTITCYKEYLPIQCIENVLQISYQENYGMAFGINFGSKFIFIICSLIIICIIFKFLFTQENNLSRVKKVLLSMIVAGGISNLLDRIFRGYVVDYIDITQVLNYPIFNLADIMIVSGTIGFAILIIIDLINENKEEKGS